jgi:cell division septation protein DedD
MLKTRLLGTGTAILLADAVVLVPEALSASVARMANAEAPAARPQATTLPLTVTAPHATAFTGALSNLTTSVVNGVGSEASEHLTRKLPSLRSTHSNDATVTPAEQSPLPSPDLLGDRDDRDRLQTSPQS